MKNWQYGYSRSELKKVVAFYEDYNKFTLSPFAKVKPNDIARWKHYGSCGILYTAQGALSLIYHRHSAKVRTPIYACGETLLGSKEPGDITLSYINGTPEEISHLYDRYLECNTWLKIWAEDETQNNLAKNSGFRYIGGKVTTFGEIYSIYFREGTKSLFGTSTRAFCELPRIEWVNIRKVMDVDVEKIKTISDRVQLFKLSPKFTNHYSNYNVKKAWSALSLRGYTPDPAFITKPTEMNKKWQTQHQFDTFAMQDTPIYKDFPEVKDLLAFHDGPIHRVRFMRLKPGGGELSRHTDQADPTMGVRKGQLMRFHFPLKTNDDVIFESWNYDGSKSNVNMKVGTAFYLDIRKPHRAVNGGTEERIHLVVDLEVTDKLIDLVTR